MNPEISPLLGLWIWCLRIFWLAFQNRIFHPLVFFLFINFWDLSLDNIPGKVIFIGGIVLVVGPGPVLVGWSVFSHKRGKFFVVASAFLMFWPSNVGGVAPLDSVDLAELVSVLDVIFHGLVSTEEVNPWPLTSLEGTSFTIWYAILCHFEWFKS